MTPLLPLNPIAIYRSREAKPERLDIELELLDWEIK
jgi:hypothetical protein